MNSGFGRRTIAAAVLAGGMAAACSSSHPMTPAPPGHETPPAGPSVPSPAPTSTPSFVETPTVPPASEPPQPTQPAFHGAAAPIDDATAGRMANSWHEGCPVPLKDLRLLSLDHWGFDGKVHMGEMVVHHTVAADVITVFRRLFDSGFPMRRMVLVEEYGADDDRSMAANNTSAFNCRPVTGGSTWSEHSYGWAIDINPIQNPYVTSGGAVLPPAGAPYVDRSIDAPGMIQPTDPVVDAFASIGWKWGGTWSSIKDYQHFSATGR